MSEVTPAMHADMQTIVGATQWLASSPDTHTGFRYGSQYVVKEMATTDDQSRISPQGVYFGHINVHHEDGRLQTSGSIVLVDHGDERSYHDYVPVTYRRGNPCLRGDSGEAIDRFQLSRFHEDRIARMAANARTVLAHYGVELSR